MACLNLTNGWFVPQSWSQAPTTNVGAVTVDRTPTSISIQRDGQQGWLNMSGDFLYAVFGDPGFVAVLGRNSGASTITWTVSLVDTTGTSIGGSGPLFSVTLPSSHFPPNLAVSPGNGRLAFFHSGTGTTNTVTNMMIVRSENGSVVLSVGGSISNLNSNVVAQITATELIIHHPNTGPNNTTAGPRPAGSLSVSPSPRNFGEAVLGASEPSLSTKIGQFTLSNTGTDCITVSGVGNMAPYTVTPASQAQLPKQLGPGESFTVEVQFSPTTIGTNIFRSLPVSRSPAAGDSTLDCVGDARAAVASISLSRSSIDFGKIPHPGTATESFTITNSGEINVNLSVPAPPPGAFAWAPGTFALPVSGPAVPVSVTFTTPGDFAAAPVTLTVTPTQGSAKSLTLNGEGCIATAVPELPVAEPISFGDIERGFRTVRIREVLNHGDGDLTVEARILPGADPSHAPLFGLVLAGADITDAPAFRSYSIPPISRCGSGPVGDGRETIAVSFFADGAPDLDPYEAVLELSVPGGGASATYGLSATITPPVPVDGVLVFDRSGSMTAPSGTRTKLEAAQAAGELFIQLLREDAEDRASIVSFNELPTDDFPITPVLGNQGALIGALGFSTGGFTNIAGGLILGIDEFTDPAHPSSPPGLKKAIVVLSDGMENRAFQIDGMDPWYSITGADAADGMRRPDGTPQDTEALPPPPGIKIYSVGLGNPANIDAAALDAISSATGGYFSEVVDLTGDDFFLLEKFYTQVFMDAVELAVIADPFYTIGAGNEHVHEFDIFPGDVNAMVVIYDHPQHGRLPFHLVSPAGEQISGASLPPGFGVRFRSTTSARFVEITFPKGEADRYATTMSRHWQIVVKHAGYTCFGTINSPEKRADQKQDPVEEIGAGFLPMKCRDTRGPIPYGVAIGAGSNLRMQAFVEPGVKYLGDSIRLNGVLAEAGLPLAGAHVTVSAKSPSGSPGSLVLRDDGAHQDGAADNGDYGGQFLNTSEAGVYHFLFRAQGTHAGRPFKREAHRTKVVYDPRTPPGVGGTGGGKCCRKLLKALREREQEAARRERKPSKPKASGAS